MNKAWATGLLVIYMVSGCSGSSSSAACQEWQREVRSAYRGSRGGALGHVNLISEELIANSVVGRPDGCPIPPSEDA